MYRYLFILIAISLSACKKDKNIDEPDKWVGIYGGSAIYTHTAPKDTMMVTTLDTSDVTVNVSKGNTDSTYNLDISYVKWPQRTLTEINFKSDGSHSSSSGTGSSYKSLYIKFSSDSLKVSDFRKCGIPCGSSYSFYIPKK